MRLFSYALVHDTGFAPCTDKSLFTLAYCKPAIRRTAQVGDIIAAFYAKSQPRKEFAYKLAYIARVTKVLTCAKYASEYPNRTDSIYTVGLKQKQNPFHTKKNVRTDLGGRNVLLSDDFIFFGDNGVQVKARFRPLIKRGQGHLVNMNEPLKKPFASLFAQYKEEYGTGIIGRHIHEKRQNKKEDK